MNEGNGPGKTLDQEYRHTEYNEKQGTKGRKGN